MEPIGLYQLNSLVKKVFRDRFPDTFLLVAEIADIKENRSGHCYLELVEKRESDDAVIASARATASPARRSPACARRATPASS